MTQLKNGLTFPVNIKPIAREACPPIIWRIARRIKARGGWWRPPAFEGPFATWEAAASRADGWDAPIITEKTVAAAKKVRAGLAEFEQDGLVRPRINYSSTILAFLAYVLSVDNKNPQILDFGGGLGSNYHQNRKILSCLFNTSVVWNVVERPILAKIGAEQFETSNLHFYSSLEDALSAIATEVHGVIFTGSLQTLQEPFRVLDQVVRYGAKMIAFDRLLVGPGAKHEIFVQHPDPKIYYPACYPVWHFSASEFVGWMESKRYTLIDHISQAPNASFDHCGMLFVRDRNSRVAG